MFLGDNVVDVKRKFRGGFRKVAVFAKTLRPSNDFCFERAVRTGHG
jgi:hypothetical protein